MRLILKSLVTTSLVAILVSTSFPSTCFTTPPPCFSHTKFDTIFTGTVKSIDSLMEVHPPMIYFDVIEEFKGVGGKKTMRLFRGFSSASFDSFKVGEKYLIYGRLDKEDEKKTDLSTGFCMGPKPLGFAEEDIAYLRELNGDKPSYLIWGTFFNYTYTDSPSVQGIRAEVRDGNKKLVGISDKRGNLRIEVSKEGDYVVEVFKPKGVELGMSEWFGSAYPEITAMWPVRGGKKSFKYKVTVGNRKCAWFDVALSKKRP